MNYWIIIISLYSGFNDVVLFENNLLEAQSYPQYKIHDDNTKFFLITLYLASKFSHLKYHQW